MAGGCCFGVRLASHTISALNEVVQRCFGGDGEGVGAGSVEENEENCQNMLVGWNLLLLRVSFDHFHLFSWQYFVFCLFSFSDRL